MKDQPIGLQSIVLIWESGDGLSVTFRHNVTSSNQFTGCTASSRSTLQSVRGHNMCEKISPFGAIWPDLVHAFRLGNLSGFDG